MIDVFEMTRAAKYRRLRAPISAEAPAAAVPVPPRLVPSPLVPPRERPASPSALDSLMKRHDRIRERHLRNG